MSESRAGLVVVRSKPKEPSPLTQETIKQCGEIDVSAKGISRACHYDCVDQDYPLPHLALYKVSDLQSILRQESEIWEEYTSHNEHLDLDANIYEFVEKYKPEAKDGGFSPVLMLAGITPPSDGDDDLSSWYRNEHFEQMSREPGWLRTTRYKLVRHIRGPRPNDESPTWMAIHEFSEQNALGHKVVPLIPMTDWSKKVMSEAQKIDAAIYRLA